MIISLERAIELLLEDEIVALPTETVYGLAGSATSDIAVSKIYKAKNRPSYNPLILHASSLEEAMQYGVFSSDAIKLAASFWPGPITIVVKLASSKLSKIVTNSLETIAIRVPDHEIFREAIKATGKALAAPSANQSSKISPTRAEHIIQSFAGKVPVVDGGKALYGIESTIVDCSGEIAKILRHGFITQDLISNILSYDLAEANQCEIIKAPGMLQKHYSPECYIRINAEEAFPDEMVLNFGSSNLIGYQSLNLSPSGDLTEAASNLYHHMRFAENIVNTANLKGITVAQIPHHGIGIAINDKLNRACF